MHSSTLPGVLSRRPPDRLNRLQTRLESAGVDGDGNVVVVWAVRAPDGAPVQVTGEVEGVGDGPGPRLTGALSVGAEAALSVLFDPCTDGYNNTLDLLDPTLKPTQAVNDPDRSGCYTCPECGGSLFYLSVKLVYQSGTVSELLSNMPDNPEKLFNDFIVDGICARCEHVHRIAEYDGL